MSAFTKFIDEKNPKLTVNSAIGPYYAAIRELWQKRFPSKPAANTYLQNAVKNATQVLKDLKFEDETKKFSEIPGGKAAKARADFIAAVDAEIHAADDACDPPPPAAPTVSYATIAKRFDVNTLEAKLDANTKTKICSVFARGKAYKGHGPTTALGAGVLHAHVGNGDGIAFKWDGDTLVIVGYGTKYDKAPSGNSGYKWTTK